MRQLDELPDIPPERLANNATLAQKNIRTECARGHVIDYLRRHQKFQDDEDYDIRIMKDCCKACFYILGSLNSGPTAAACKLCGIKAYSGSVIPDFCCGQCAKDMKLCCRCGGDIEMKLRRK